MDGVNLDTLWAWSNKESGAAVMRWNNPLNTTEIYGTSMPMNDVGVQFYPEEWIGVSATVATLENGYYPVILANLRGSVPRAQWGNACANLGTWGTGCDWLQSTYGPAPGNLGGDMDPDTLAKLQAFLNGMAGGGGQGGGYDFAGIRYWLAGGGQYDPGHPETAPNAKMLGALTALQTQGVTVDQTAILAAIADLKAHPAAADPTVLAIVTRIENGLKGA